MPGAHLGLAWPVEKVDEVGVLKSLGEGGRKEEKAPSPGRDWGLAMTSGGGRRRASTEAL